MTTETTTKAGTKIANLDRVPAASDAEIAIIARADTKRLTKRDIDWARMTAYVDHAAQWWRQPDMLLRHYRDDGRGLRSTGKRLRAIYLSLRRHYESLPDSVIVGMACGRCGTIMPPRHGNLCKRCAANLDSE